MKTFKNKRVYGKGFGMLYGIRNYNMCASLIECLWGGNWGEEADRFDGKAQLPS